jgi:hypothetical protein
MWHDRRQPYPEDNHVLDSFLLWIAGLLFVGCGLVWLIGQVAAILFGAHQHLPVRLVDMLGVLPRLPSTWDDPAQAWPTDVQPLLPGPVGMYAAAVLTFWLPPWPTGSWSGCCPRGPAANASSAASSGPTSGSCDGCWW